MAIRSQYPRIRRAEGGATFNLEGRRRRIGEAGYAVSIRGHEEQCPPDDFFSDWQAEIIAGYVARHRAALDKLGAYIGIYFDAAAAVVYLDTSHVEDELAAAVRAGEAAGQQSIFDFLSGQVIPLDTAKGRELAARPA